MLPAAGEGCLQRLHDHGIGASIHDQIGVLIICEF